MIIEDNMTVYENSSNFVFSEIRESTLIEKPSNLLFIALDEHLALPIGCEEEFKMWVKNVPHFVGHLWEWREIEYIERFNKIAFNVANRLNLSNNDGCKALVSLFLKYATWQDDPSNFSLSEENLIWLKDRRQFQDIFLWIEKAPFLLESDLVAFKKKNGIK